MADVDLLVAVSTAGVPSAVNDINKLDTAASASTRGFTKLGQATELAMRQVRDGMRLATATSKTYDQAIKSTEEDARSLTVALKALNAEYNRLASIKPGATARERLTASGGAGGLAAGMRTAGTIQALNDSLGADATRDLITVKKELLALERARNSVLQAQQGLARATYQASLSGMNQQQRALVNLTKAEGDYAAAQILSRFAKADKTGSVAAAEALAKAIRDEEQALRALTSAQKENKAATDAATASIARQKAELIAAQRAATNQRLALRSAGYSRTDANTNVGRAREDLANQRAGLDAVARATVNVSRATQDLALAEERRKATGIGATNGARTAALQSEAQAVRQLAQAESQLAASSRKDVDSDNAFQSSYSYFIIAGLATAAATAILSVGTASIMATAQIERSFIDVERTFDGTSAQLSSLRTKLTELSTTTPNSLVDLSQIAALGNQLGVAAEDIESFTTTVAQYSTISGVSAEETATAFGKIGNLTGLAASQYSNLASAISYVARTSAATESTIQNTSKEITALASGAGFSAASIVGLAGALSSLAIPPERARGSLSLYFGALNSAVAEGGPKLDAFATLTGKTADEIGRLVRDGKGEEVFTSFIAGLAELDTVAKTTALDDLGLSTIRVDQTMRALAQNVPLLTKSLTGANTAFTENTELGRQYAIVQEALATKMAEFKNAVTNAAAAIGGNLAGAFTTLLEASTKALVAFNAFSSTEYGQSFLKTIAAIALIAATVAGLIGALALGKASLVVFAFAMNGLGWGAATTGLRGLIANLFLTGSAARASAFNLTSFKVALAESTIRARAAAFAVGALKFALLGIGIGLIIEGFSQLDQAINRSKNAADGLGGSAEELVAAMKADNTKLFADAVSETGKKAGGAADGVQTLNESVRAGIEAQQEMRDSADQVNGKIDEQAIKVGKATQAWVRSAVLQSDAMQEILNNAQLSADLQAMMDAGFDLGKYSDLAYTKGAEEAEAYREGWAKGLGPGKAVGRGRYAGLNDDDPVGSAIGANGRVGNSIGTIGTGLEERKRQSVLMDAISGTTDEIVDGTAAVDGYGRAMLDASGAAIILSNGTSGAKNSIEEYRGAVNGALKDFVDFKNILEKVTEAQNKANEREEGPAGTDTSLINATEFGKQLDLANGEAATFFTNISALAASGSTSFATQIAELGPEAQGILASATTLDGPALAKLEEGARLAGFFASTAFTNAMKETMADSNDAYATIFKKTGDMNDVKSYIAAQVAGTGAAWEAAWAAENPNLPLNVDIKNPTPEEIRSALRLADGSLKVEADVVTTFTGLNGTTVKQEAVRVITDAVTGNTFTVPATIDDQGLTTALAVWDQNQNASPTQIAALLETAGISADLAVWIAALNPATVGTNLDPGGLNRGMSIWKTGNTAVTVRTTFVATNTAASIISPFVRIPVYLQDPKLRAKGGIIDSYATGGKIKDGLPAFASGGSWGQFRGPGTGTSDSILARVSAGEYINTAKSTSFWGPDFFDSLNRNMLPTSFLNMLGAAAGGNNGPSSVTNVSVNQINPLTRDPLKQLREDSEMVASGIWG